MRRAFLVAAACALALPGVTSAHVKKHHRVRHHRVRHAAKHHLVRRDELVVSHVGLPKPPPHTVPLPPAPRPVNRLQVVAREWSVLPSRFTVPSGRVVVELANFGQDPHDLRVERAGEPATGFDFTLAKPGDRESRSLQLGPGTWKLYCTLPGHDQLGMHTTVTVG